MRINDHIHSRLSFDGEYPLTELCRAAKTAGVTALCLTDHCDLVNEQGAPDDSFDWAAEERELAAARARFPEMDLRLGVELGQAILRPEAAERVLSHGGIDFVLGSMHNTREGGDYYYLTYTDKGQCQALLEDYLQCLLELSRTDYFDSLAHLTYPLRYMRLRDGEKVSLRPFDGLVREILRTLAERGKALELNTSGYGTEAGEPLPPEYILRMYKDAGGELVTIGSDAHTPEKIGTGLEAGLALLRRCGFRYVTRYQGRKPRPIKMEEFV